MFAYLFIILNLQYDNIPVCGDVLCHWDYLAKRSGPNKINNHLVI